MEDILYLLQTFTERHHMKNIFCVLILSNAFCYGFENGSNLSGMHAQPTQSAEAVEATQSTATVYTQDPVEKFTFGQLISGMGFGYCVGLLSKKAARIPRGVTVPAVLFFGVATIAPKFVHAVSTSLSREALHQAQKTAYYTYDKARSAFDDVERRAKQYTDRTTDVQKEQDNNKSE